MTEDSDFEAYVYDISSDERRWTSFSRASLIVACAGLSLYRAYQAVTHLAPVRVIFRRLGADGLTEREAALVEDEWNGWWGQHEAVVRVGDTLLSLDEIRAMRTMPNAMEIRRALSRYVAEREQAEAQKAAAG